MTAHWRHWFMALALAAFSTSAIANSDDVRLPPASKFYPLVPGSSWDYAVTIDGMPSEVSYRVSPPEHIDNLTLHRIDTVSSGAVISTEHLSHSEKGVSRHRYNGTPMDPPLLIIKEPVAVGDFWKSSVSVAEIEMDIECKVVQVAQVIVPAGEFQALEVFVGTTVNEVKVESTYWFAPEVGIVKQDIEIGEQKFAMELKQLNLPDRAEAPQADTPQSNQLE